MRPYEIASLLTHLREHLVLVAASAVLAAIFAFPLGVYIASRTRHTAWLASLGIVYTIPSLALFALLVPPLGLGFPTALAVLTIYAVVFLTRTVVLALHGLSPQIRENAIALGATPLERLIRIELPLMGPALIAGLRTTCIMLISTASIAAWIDAGGLGVLFFEGLRQDDMHRVVTGSIAAGLAAICVDASLAAIERLLRETTRG